MNKELIYEIAKYTNDSTILKVIFRLSVNEQDNLLKIVKYLNFYRNIYPLDATFINEVIKLYCQEESKDVLMSLFIDTPLLVIADISEIKTYINYGHFINHPLLFNRYLISYYHGERHWQLIRYLVSHERDDGEYSISDGLLYKRTPDEIISLYELTNQNSLIDKTLNLSYAGQMALIKFYCESSLEMQSLIDLLLDDSAIIQTIPEPILMSILIACELYLINRGEDIFKCLQDFLKKNPEEVVTRMQIWAICQYRKDIYQLLTDHRFEQISLHYLIKFIMYYHEHFYDQRIFNIINQYSCVGDEAISKELEHLTYNDFQKYLEATNDIHMLLPILNEEKKYILK